MIPNNADRLAMRRFLAMQACSAGGVVVMLVGLWVWLSSGVRPGGLPALGLPLFLLGAALSMLLPKLLARRWRSPPPR